ncbi:DUF2017 family protein [Stomatohabitans albus]|uniref:DUF2017 family protein n=1 Tax=Stomatohabitans albus TaxID=3110766 RepID=UPI00300C6B53
MGSVAEPHFQLRDDNTVHVAMSLDEYQVFNDMVSMVHGALIHTDPTQPLPPTVDRLFPSIFENPLEALAYDKHNAEFVALRHLKLNRFARVLQQLELPGQVVGQKWRTQITIEELDVWMVVIQDIRLSLSQIANVQTEDDMDHLADEWRQLLVWLAYLLEEIIHIFLKSD